MPEDEVTDPAEQPEPELSTNAANPSDEPSEAVAAEEEVESAHLLSFLVAGIGASAGGVEAFISLFTQLPSNTGIAYVVAPHLSPDQKSMLPGILARHTEMQVIEIASGMRPEPDRVYVLPAAHSVRLRRGTFHLEPAGGDFSKHPIDAFFRSLAQDQKNRAIGVVLSGMDSDGALGLKAIKGEGGITMVQAPETARFPDMPRSSISADHVDFILPPAAIATNMAQLGLQFRSAGIRALEETDQQPREEQHFTRILTLLRGVSGVDFRLYKPTTIRRRITRRMMLHRIDDVAAYEALLRSNNRELRELHEDALINVTRFFRDSDVFEALKSMVFPQLFDRRPADQQVRVWVAGCSSGEEVYSLAMCLLEFLTGSVSEPPIQIFGTDASEPNIQRARAGLYPETITAEVSPERLRRFFTKTEKGYQVAKRVRDLCIFARQNLCHDPPFSRIDLISCRNVLIYLGMELQRQIIPTFHYALRQNGFLLLGTSETIREFTDLFSLADRKNKIFAKIGSTPSRGFVDVAPRLYSPDLLPDIAERQPPQVWSDVELQRAADRIVLARFGPPGVVVNERLEILQSRGHTAAFFEMPQGQATLQLPRMARESLAPYLTEAVRRAVQEDVPVQVESVTVTDGDQTSEFAIEVLPIHTIQTRPKCYLVLFVPWHAPRDRFDTTVEAVPATIDEQERSVARMRHDLASTRLYLQSLLEERDAKNQELVSANEEIQSANEELQSTNEELETTKEELQSSNEELQTVNDELQHRNTVLTQASNDLSNLLNSVNLPVLMLSNDLRIRHFTPPAQKLMNVRASDVGRPFGELRMNLNIDNLEPMLLEVLDTLNAREIEAQDREGRWHLLRVRPYRTTDNKIEGLVVVLVDIDQHRRTQHELREARDFARLVIESVPLPLVVVDLEYRIRTVNEAFARLAGCRPEELLRQFLPHIAAAQWGLEEPLRSRLAELRVGNGASRTFQFEHTTTAENPRTLTIRGCVLRPDSEMFLLVTVEDSTAHKLAEQSLQQEGERLAAQVESATRELGRNREDLRGLASSLFTSQEDERRHMARELHDDISQRLARLEMDAEQLGKSVAADPPNVMEMVARFRTDIASLSADVRAISHRIHPSIIDDLGLGAALRALTDDFRDREQMIATYFEENVPEALRPEIATVFYRIAQEALRNVSKHAGRTHVKVSLRGTDGRLRLQVTDAGLGFDPDDAPRGLGLVSMRERARQIGASFEVESALGEGTRVIVDAPVAAGA